MTSAPVISLHALALRNSCGFMKTPFGRRREADLTIAQQMNAPGSHLELAVDFQFLARNRNGDCDLEDNMYCDSLRWNEGGIIRQRTSPNRPLPRRRTSP